VKGAGVGKIFPGIRCAIGRDIYAFKPREGMSPKFVELALLNTVQDIIFHAKGDIPGLSKSHILDHSIALPGSAEQERIASKILELFSDLDKGEESLRQAQAQLKRYRQSVLKAAVTGELTRDWREQNKDRLETGDALLERILKARRAAWEKAELEKMRAKGVKPKDDSWKKKYVEPKGPDTSGLPELPEGWAWVSLEQLTSMITSGSRGWSDYYASTGSIFIRAQDIKTDELSLASVAFVKLPPNAEGMRTLVKKDDILVTITGANVTKSALVKDNIGESYVSQHVALARPVDYGMSWYIYTWIICPTHGRKRLEIDAYGAGKPGLILEDLRELVVAIPSQDEQDAIRSRVMDCLEQLNTIQEDIRKLTYNNESLRQSILKSAFSGTLVPQDPNDEPAWELLKRIAIKKAAPASPPVARRAAPRQKRREAPAPAKQAGGPTASPPKQTASRLAQLRKAAGMSQAELAKAIGLNQAYISQMETGKRAISNEIARAMSKALEVDLTSFAV
jgi:type I restriction enzyme S subunit